MSQQQLQFQHQQIAEIQRIQELQQKQIELLAKVLECILKDPPKTISRAEAHMAMREYVGVAL